MRKQFFFAAALIAIVGTANAQNGKVTIGPPDGPKRTTEKRYTVYLPLSTYQYIIGPALANSEAITAQQYTNTVTEMNQQISAQMAADTAKAPEADKPKPAK